jgi:hypothetical protein
MKPVDARVSVVVLTHERPQELERTLQRLAALPEQPALVVVDNAALPATEAMVRRFQCRRAGCGRPRRAWPVASPSTGRRGAGGSSPAAAALRADRADRPLQPGLPHVHGQRPRAACSERPKEKRPTRGR